MHVVPDRKVFKLDQEYVVNLKKSVFSPRILRHVGPTGLLFQKLFVGMKCIHKSWIMHV